MLGPVMISLGTEKLQDIDTSTQDSGLLYTERQIWKDNAFVKLKHIFVSNNLQNVHITRSMDFVPHHFMIFGKVY